jgi:hypothetical protein
VLTADVEELNSKNPIYSTIRVVHNIRNRPENTMRCDAGAECYVRLSHWPSRNSGLNVNRHFSAAIEQVSKG